jgi:hypothetical protein
LSNSLATTCIGILHTEFLVLLHRPTSHDKSQRPKPPPHGHHKISIRLRWQSLAIFRSGFLLKLVIRSQQRLSRLHSSLLTFASSLVAQDQRRKAAVSVNPMFRLPQCRSGGLGLDEGDSLNFGCRLVGTSAIWRALLFEPLRTGLKVLRRLHRSRTTVSPHRDQD